MQVSQTASEFFSIFKLAISLDSTKESRMKLGSSAKYFIFIVWCSACFIVGLLIFASGLLLHRNVLPNKSSCVHLAESCRNFKTLSALEKCLLSHSARQIEEQICTDSKFKIVLIIIDALRYDFVEYNEHSSDESFHTNKLVVVKDLLENEPNKSRLFKFMADPPTTTMQRILGLTTGSLPTFIDVGSNFASSEIYEDNIVDMLNRHGKNVIFLGDDTWTKLYPNRFIRSYPFDSFNVWDLDTVDYGIREHLFTELRKNDWSMLIAHFLGVDHCGHRYGPYHPEMKRKLEEMNEVLRNVVDHIKHKDDTLLFVIGDHGMTSTGDHGGDTENEISTALFAYSPVHDLFASHAGSRVMRQVDMAPTFSSILGLPIPFSSVGSVVLECFPVAVVGSLSETVFQLWRNAEQITNYVVEYSLHNAQLRVTNKVDATLLRFQRLKEMRAAILSDAATFRREHRAFMTDILNMCRDVWVQFDTLAIGCGLCVLLVATLLCYRICESLSSAEALLLRSEYLFLGKAVVLLSFAVIFVAHLCGATVHFGTLLAIAVVCTSLLAWWCRQLCAPVEMSAVRRLTVFNAFAISALLVSLGGLFSNSFIVEEPSVILFLICSVLCVHLVFHRPKAWRRVTLLAAGTHIALRVALEFLKCHEEQARCQDIVVKKFETRLCVVSIVAVASLVASWLRNHPPKFYAAVAALCTSLLAVYWICETLEQLTFAQDIPVVVLPLAVCSIYHLLLTPRPRNVDGVWSLFDESFSSVALFLALLGCVVLGQTYAVPVVLMVVCCRTLAVFLCSCYRSDSFNRKSPRVPWSDVMLWSMSSIYWFYATGHYASFAGIQWNAAFLLQKEIGDKMLIPGILVILNTFFSYVVHGITLPVLFVTQWAPFSEPELPVRPVNGATSKNTEIHPHTLEYLYYGVFRLILQYLTLFGLRLFFVILSATILSRHLMMWKIFAPKFIFEAIAFMVSVVSLLLGFVCVCRIGSRIRGDAVVRNKRST